MFSKITNDPTQTSSTITERTKNQTSQPSWLTQTKAITGLAAFTIGSLALFAYQMGYFTPVHQHSFHSQFNNQTQCPLADTLNSSQEICPASLSLTAANIPLSTLASIVAAVAKLVNPPSNNASTLSLPRTPSLSSQIQTSIANYWYNFKLTYFNKPDEGHFRDLGRRFLKDSYMKINEMSANKVDLAYQKEWQSKEQCPLASDYAQHLLEQKKFNGFRIESLRTLFGNESDLSDGETRSLYHHLIGAQSAVPSDNNNCLTKALSDSLIRTNARLYTRERMKNRDEAKMLFNRDRAKYGTAIPTPLYMTGKCVDQIRDNCLPRVCECLSQKSNKTNWFFDSVSRFFG